MAFDLTIPQPSSSPLTVTVNIGETLFLLGANGAGKSNLMHLFYQRHRNNAKRISAHRQTWLSTNAITLSPEQKRSTDINIRNADTEAYSRWRDDYAPQRPSIAIYDLIDAENVRARTIAEAVDAADIDLAKTLAKNDAPIKVINEILRLSNIPIKISVEGNDQVVASKSGSSPYSIAELSDGERNALLVAADVLTVPSETLILIDEPERHLHRSIISPLLTSLFEKRPDCAFVVSTHEVMLPIDNQTARTLLIRGCVYSGVSVTGWDVDLVEPDSEIDESLRRDILGARRKLLFIEGTENSLDKPLYGLVFPGVSIVPKSSSREVENAVAGISAAASLHWLQPFGVIDNDGRTQTAIDELKASGIYALSVYSVESIYYDPDVQRLVAERQAAVTGADSAALIANAKAAGFAAIMPHTARLSRRAVEKTIREDILHRLPGQPEIKAGNPINISIDLAAVASAQRTRLEDNIANENFSEIISGYPIRETPALTTIARALGFQDRNQYESAVRKLLIDDSSALAAVRSFFGTLTDDIGL
ncbi:MAG: ATP-binding protein [Pyrinomonadaceae bacterium]|nr:ATP-binding protein [Pyrinomonadaceae bacterium]